MEQAITPALKKEIIETCRQRLLDKQQALEQALLEINESINTETKSSVGDKHETARARMQFEQEKLQKQLMEQKQMFDDFEKITETVATEIVGLNSLLQTNKGLFFISVPLGKIKVETTDVYVISPASPIALLMKGLKSGQSFNFKQTGYTVDWLD